MGTQNALSRGQAVEVNHRVLDRDGAGSLQAPFFLRNNPRAEDCGHDAFLSWIVGAQIKVLRLASVESAPHASHEGAGWAALNSPMVIGSSDVNADCFGKAGTQ